MSDAAVIVWTILQMGHASEQEAVQSRISDAERAVDMVSEGQTCIASVRRVRQQFDPNAVFRGEQ